MAHGLLYGVLGVLIQRALDRTRGGGTARTRFLLAVLIATACGVADEIHQPRTPRRSADWRDVVAGAGAATVGAGTRGRCRLSRCDG